MIEAERVTDLVVWPSEIDICVRIFGLVSDGLSVPHFHWWIVFQISLLMYEA